MDSEIEAVEQEQRPKDPMRHFIPLEVPSFRGEQVTTQRSVVVSLRALALPKKTVSRPGPFLNERQRLPTNIQAQMASGPGDYDHLVYRGWEMNFGDSELKEDKTQSDKSSSG